MRHSTIIQSERDKKQPLIGSIYWHCCLKQLFVCFEGIQRKFSGNLSIASITLGQ